MNVLNLLKVDIRYWDRIRIAFFVSRIVVWDNFAVESAMDDGCLQGRFFKMSIRITVSIAYDKDDGQVAGITRLPNRERERR